MHVINLVPRIEQKRTQQALILDLKLEYVICELKKLILRAFHFMLKSRWQSRERARRAVFYRRALSVLRRAEDMQQNSL